MHRLSFNALLAFDRSIMCSTPLRVLIFSPTQSPRRKAGHVSFSCFYFLLLCVFLFNFSWPPISLSIALPLFIFLLLTLSLSLSRQLASCRCEISGVGVSQQVPATFGWLSLDLLSVAEVRPTSETVAWAWAIWAHVFDSMSSMFQARFGTCSANG